MTIRPHKHIPGTGLRRWSGGFSLLEALIAVVVLSTGLLALAALQSAMIRSSADARARSAAAAAAASVIEDWRTDYATVPVGAGTVAPPSYVVTDAAVGNFTIQYSTTQWFDNGAGAFVTGTPNPALPPPLAEFKEIDLTVSWNDPYNPGNSRSIQVSDIIGPLGASLQSPDLTQLGGNLAPQQPIVRTKNPAGPGVIPIAIGDDTDTAATNPRPEIIGKGPGKGTVIETRFDVLNFSGGGIAEDLSIVRLQKRVETSLVACRCTLGASPGSTGTIAAAAVRPTFWDGVRYAPPKPTGTAGLAAPSTSASAQSELCTECCRDHHDPTGVEGPKFDPFRVENGIAHDHFRVVDPDPVTTVDNSLPASGGSDYLEACRVIRVDGLWRVAADFDSRLFGLLKTSGADPLPASDPVPDPVASDSYADFVLKVLNDEFVSLTPTVRSEEELKTLYASDPFLLDEPLDLFINRPTASDIDFRFLHARGFYVDHLEQEALDRIKKAGDDCPTDPPGQRADCILPFLPFTTVNVTELAKWRPAASPPGVQVTNASGVIFGDPTDPIRGKVNALASGPDTDDVLTSNSRSNSGLVATNLFVDPQDVLGVQNDAQTFSMSASGTAGDGFTVNLELLPQTSDNNTANDPKVAWQIAPAGNNCPGDFTGAGNDNDPNPYRCTTFSTLSATNVGVIVRDYNRELTQQIVNPCTSTGKKVNQPVCENYAIDKVFVTGIEKTVAIAVSGENTLAESSTATIPALNAGENVRLRFIRQTRTEAQAQCQVGSTEPVWISCWATEP